GLAVAGSPPAQAAPARRLAILAAGAELVVFELLKRRVEEVAETYEQGRAGSLMRAAQLLSVTGAAGAATAGRHSRVAAAVSGLALLAASASTRFGVFAAGMRSAQDPRYTVEPQRRRRNGRT
ncbi:MAG: hypothetical protein QOI73_3437, partial [Solirubrobacteraceae bacterium]|nr:hypothetical protein [Solirubrobacteraceae bacterium]